MAVGILSKAISNEIPLGNFLCALIKNDVGKGEHNAIERWYILCVFTKTNGNFG